MSFEIGELHPNSPHLFADLAVLLLLLSYKGRSYIHSNDLESLITSSDINSDEIDEEKDEQAEERSSAERHSRADRQIEDVLSQLEYRAKAFGDSYPFTVSGQKLKIKPSLNESHRVYRLLVSCSRLRSFNKAGIPQNWARVFARVAKIAMAGLASQSAVTRIFDANSDDRRDYYGTDLREALKVLGRDLAVLKVNEDECNKASSSGDAGYDLVSVLSFNDGAATHHALLGQCGAQETEWPKKTLEAHPINCQHFFQMQLAYQSVMFTPVCYRNTTGEWVNNKCTNGVLLVDRLRAIHLIGIQAAFADLSTQSWFIDFETKFGQFVFR